MVSGWCYIKLSPDSIYTCANVQVFIYPFINAACKNMASSNFSPAVQVTFTKAAFFYVRLQGYVHFFQVQIKKIWLINCYLNIITRYSTVVYQMNSETTSTAEMCLSL